MSVLYGRCAGSLGWRPTETLEHVGKVAILFSLDCVKLCGLVTLGDQLVMKATTPRATKLFGEPDCERFVNSRLIAESPVRFMMVEPEQL